MAYCLGEGAVLYLNPESIVVFCAPMLFRSTSDCPPGCFALFCKASPSQFIKINQDKLLSAIILYQALVYHIIRLDDFIPYRRMV
jgi:hypothetical protein